MSDTGTDQPGDRDLMARLRAADPASALPPADPAVVDRLLEDTMSNDLSNDLATPDTETGTGRRNPLTWLVAAAAAVVIAGVGIFTVLGHSDDTGPVATGPVTQLTTGAPQGRCMVPTAQSLGDQTVAFAGTVVSVAGDSVTLQVSHWYKGGTSGKVLGTVKVVAPSPDLLTLDGVVDFQKGRDYLVSATDGRVTGCGFSGPATSGLSTLYEKAF